MSRTPDFILKALNRRTEQRTGKIGCAWQNEDGSITIQLDMCTSLMADPDLLVTLFPNDRPTTQSTAAAAAKSRKQAALAEAFKDGPALPPTSLIHKIIP